MPSTIKFIDSIIRNIEPTEKRQNLWCIGCPGFGLRVTKTGVKTFAFKYTVTLQNKKRVTRWVTIGKYPEWSIRQARHKYDELYEQVYDYGRDIVQEEKDEKAQQVEQKSVRDLSLDYMENGRLKGKKHIDEEERYFRTDIWPVIGDMLPSEVRHADVEKIQENILKRSKKVKSATQGGRYAVKYAVGAVRRLFEFAIKKGLATHNPAKGIDLSGTKNVRSRVLSFEEIWTFWNRIEMLDISPVPAKALKFLLATMQRSNEVKNMRYNSVDIGGAVWQMERYETKNGTMHRVPLNKYALDLIKEIRPWTHASPYIFGSTKLYEPPKTPNSKLQPLGRTSLSHAIRRNRKHLGIDDFRPHDLRRTGATWITAVGLPKLYARLMLNHSDGERDVTGEVYVQYSYDFEKQRAAKVWEFILDQIVTCKSKQDIPTLEELRTRVREAGLL